MAALDRSVGIAFVACLVALCASVTTSFVVLGPRGATDIAAPLLRTVGFLRTPSLGAGQVLRPEALAVHTSTSTSLFSGCTASNLVAFGALVGAVGRLAVSRTKRNAKVRGTWKEKQQKNADYLKRNPPPIMRKRDAKKRIIRCQLMRREDMEWTEWACYIDPRDDEFQWSVEKTRAVLENPDYVTIEKKRKELGMPMPPFSLCEKALKEMRGAGGRISIAPKVDEEVAGKKRGPVDLSKVESEYAEFKGFKLSKAQPSAKTKRR